MTNFGAFVELADGVEGLIHVSEFDDSHGGEKIDLQVDQTYQMKVIKLSPAERKIGLSIRALKSDEYRTRLGDLLQRVGQPDGDAGRSLPQSGVGCSRLASASAPPGRYGGARTRRS